MLEQLWGTGNPVNQVFVDFRQAYDILLSISLKFAEAHVAQPKREPLATLV